MEDREELQTREYKTYRLGKLYLSERRGVPNPEGRNQYSRIARIVAKKTGESLGDEYKISEKTVRRAAEYAKNVDIISMCKGGRFKRRILSREIKLTHSEVRDMAIECAEGSP